MMLCIYSLKNAGFNTFKSPWQCCRCFSRCQIRMEATGTVALYLFLFKCNLRCNAYALQCSSYILIAELKEETLTHFP